MWEGEWLCSVIDDEFFCDGNKHEYQARKDQDLIGRNDASEPELKQKGRTEADRVKHWLKNYDLNTSKSYHFIRGRFPGAIRREITSIAELLSSITGIRVYREAKRNMTVMFKWFDDHWSKLKPVLERMRLLDKKGRDIAELVSPSYYQEASDPCER